MKKNARVSEKTGKPGLTWLTGSYAPDRNSNLAGLRLRSKISCIFFDYFYNKIINMENFWLGFVKVLSTH